MKKCKELLFSVTKKDFEIYWFSGTGAGGQHRNKHQNCCRLIHPQSGAMATGQKSKSRKDNLSGAFRNIIEHPKFKMWYQQKIWQALNEMSIDEIVKESMKEENLKIESKDNNGKWEPFHG
jgi:peptide chain release factor 1